MMENKQSILRFKKYIVKEVTYITNESYAPKENTKLDFDFEVSSSSNENGKNMEIELKVHIFKDALHNNYPFEMTLCIKGFFDIQTSDIDIKIFEKNAVAILFPYLRALVSTYTANANVAPVILPTMNINSYLETKYKNTRP